MKSPLLLSWTRRMGMKVDRSKFDSYKYDSNWKREKPRGASPYACPKCGSVWNKCITRQHTTVSPGIETHTTHFCKECETEFRVFHRTEATTGEGHGVLCACRNCLAAKVWAIQNHWRPMEGIHPTLRPYVHWAREQISTKRTPPRISRQRWNPKDDPAFHNVIKTIEHSFQPAYAKIRP